jgi:hypothetical protein
MYIQHVCVSKAILATCMYMWQYLEYSVVVVVFVHSCGIIALCIGLCLSLQWLACAHFAQHEFITGCHAGLTCVLCAAVRLMWRGVFPFVRGKGAVIQGVTGVLLLQQRRAPDASTLIELHEAFSTRMRNCNSNWQASRSCSCTQFAGGTREAPFLTFSSNLSDTAARI